MIICLIVAALGFFFVKDFILYQRTKNKLKGTSKGEQQRKRDNRNFQEIGTTQMNDRLNPSAQSLEQEYGIDDKAEGGHDELLIPTNNDSRAGANRLRDELNESKSTFPCNHFNRQRFFE